MRYMLVIPGVTTKDVKGGRADAEKALEVAKALGCDDAWIATIPDDDDLDGSAGEGCGY